MIKINKDSFIDTNSRRLLEYAISECNKISVNKLEKLKDKVHEFLEQELNLDLVNMLAKSVAFSTTNPDVPEEVKLILLQEWIRYKDFGPDGYRSLPLYFQEIPEVYFRLAEYIWSFWEVEKRSLQNVLLRIFADSLPSAKDALLDLYIKYLNRWLSFCLNSIYPLKFSQTPEKLDLGAYIKEYSLTSVDNSGLVRLSLVSLSLLSLRPLEKCIDGLLKFYIAGKFMRSEETKRLEWLLQGVYGEEAVEGLAGYIDFNNIQSPVNTLPLKLLKICKSVKIVQDKSLDSILDYTWDELSPDARDERIIKRYLNYRTSDFPDGEHFLNTLGKPGDYIYDPDFSKPSSINLENVAKYVKKSLTPDFDTKKGLLRQRTWMSGEDHFYEDIWPFLLACLPETASDILRSQVRSLSHRDNKQLNFIYYLEINAPVLQTDEIKAIRELRERLKQDNKDAPKLYHLFLYPVEMIHSTPEEVIKLIKDLPEDKIKYHSFEVALKQISSEKFVSDLTEALKNTEEPELEYRFLFALSNQVTKYYGSLPTKDILKYIKRENKNIIATSIKILLKIKNSEGAAKYFWDQGWKWKKVIRDSFNYLVLELIHQCKHLFKDIAYSELKHRIRWDFLGIWLGERESISELQEFGEDLLKTINRVVSGNLKTISNYKTITTQSSLDGEHFGGFSLDDTPFGTKIHRMDEMDQWQNTQQEDFDNFFRFQDDFDPNQPLYIWNKEWENFLTDDNQLYHDFVQPESLEGLAKHNLSCLQELADRVINQKSGPYRELEVCASFYYVLMLTLIKYDLERGIKLFEKMDGIMKFELVKDGLPLHFIRIFKPDADKKLLDFRKNLFNSASDDRRLYELTIASHYGDHSWVLEWSMKKIISKKARERAIGARVLGWCEDEKVSDKLHEIYEKDESLWVRGVAYNSYKTYFTNQWSKEWYRRVFIAENIDHAWADAQLFIKTADNRAYLWMDVIEKEFKERSEPKFKYLLAITREQFESECNNKRKELKDIFLNHDLKYLRDQMWPWIEKEL